ncbi:glycosyltransferase family 4 protein [soil metagenome]
MTDAREMRHPSPGERLRLLEVVGNGIVGGMESVVARLVERLPHDRYDITALCPFESRFTTALRQRDVEVFVTPMSQDPAWSSIHMACTLMQSASVDIVHAHLANAHVLAAVAGRLTGTPVLATIHERHPSLLDLQAHRLARTHLAVVSPHSYHQALGLGVEASLLSCVPNGVDTQVFRPSRTTPAQTELRASLGIPAGAPLVGFVGRLTPDKGPEVFVRSALLLRIVAPDVHLVLVGDGPMRAELLASIARFELGDRVHLAGLREDMCSVYRQLDLLVSSSFSEGMPLVVLEAMASGLPVVATQVGGVVDVVEQGETGWLVAPGDFDGLAGTVARALAAPDELLRMGVRARERAVAHFDLSDHVSQTDRLLTQLAGLRVDRTLRSIGGPAPPVAVDRVGPSARHDSIPAAFHNNRNNEP